MKKIKNTFLTTLLGLVLAGSARAQSQAKLSDLGPTEPAPKANQISQLSTTGNQNAPDGLNYYTDNGINNASVGEPGQTFTTGNHSAGYVLVSVAVRSAGLGSFSGIDTAQSYLLHLYSIQGPLATLLKSYSADNFTFEDGGWLEWSGLLLRLEPNSTYAYSMGRTSAGTGWEDFAVASGNPYAEGEMALIPAAGGSITTGSSHGFDGVFVLGLNLPGALAAGFPTVAPANTVFAGSPVTLSVQAAGADPLHFEWQSDNGTGGVTFSAMASSDTPSLVASTAQLDGWAVQYRVKVADASGSVTSPAVTVTVRAASAPVITTDTTPLAATVFVGHSATFQAGFEGTLPIRYQWQVNAGAGAADITGATNASLTVANVSLADAGTYTLLASNSKGSTTSAAVVLTVLDSTATPITAADRYASAVLGYQPIAYWRLNDASGSLGAYDFAGDSDAANTGAVFGEAGLRPSAYPGFVAENTAASFDGVASFLGSPASLMNGRTNFTILGWFSATGTNPDPRTGLFGQNDLVELGYNDTDGVSVWLPLNGTWVNPRSGKAGFSEGQWSFVALVGDGTNAHLYVNGTLRDSKSGGALSGASSYGFNIGGGGIFDATGNHFLGLIEDVAVFDKALTGPQLQGLYSAAVGSLAPLPSATPSTAARYLGREVRFNATLLAGTAPFTYQWQHAGTNLVDGPNIVGSQTAELTLIGLTTAEAGQYRVLVSNSTGSAHSEPATLSVVTPKPASYENAVISLNPVAYWRLNELSDPTSGAAVASDLLAGQDGTFGVAALNGANEIYGPRPADGFSVFETDNRAVQCAGVGNSYVVGPGLNLNSDRVTFTFWLRPSGTQSAYCGLVTTRTPVGAGVNYTSDDQIGYTWNGNNENTWSYLSGLAPPKNQWSFVAVAIGPAQATFYLINANGTQVSSNVVDHSGEVFGGPLRIGGDPQDDAARTYSGMIDEVAVFKNTLTAEQVQNLYRGVASQPPVETKLSFRSIGSSLVLTWSQGTLQTADEVHGAWRPVGNAASPYTVTPAGSKQFFRLHAQ